MAEPTTGPSQGPSPAAPESAPPGGASPAGRPAHGPPVPERPADRAAQSVSVVIPAYNEEESIGRVLEELSAWDVPAEIVVVDDGSVDGTAAVVGRYPEVRLLRHVKNLGYGAALKTGLAAATGDVVATLDADGQHVPAEVRRLLPLMGDADLVVGVRPLQRSLLPRSLGRSVLRQIAVLLTGHEIPDLNSGLKIYRRQVVLPLLDGTPDGMSFSDSILMTALARRLRVRFEGVTVRARAAGRSTVGVRTAGETLVTILRMSTAMNRSRVFMLVSASLLAAGALWAAPSLIRGRGPGAAARSLLTTGVLLLAVGAARRYTPNRLRRDARFVGDASGGSSR